MANGSNFDVKHKKRELIIERVDGDPAAKRGMKVSRTLLLLLILLRFVLFVIEVSYFSASGLEINVISNLLLLPMLLILYMIHDGNKGLSGVLLVSAAVRVVYLFASVYATLPDGVGRNIYVGAYLFAMAFQFAATLLMTAYAPCVSYFEKMQAINMEIGNLLRTGGQKSNQSQKKSSRKKKK